MSGRAASAWWRLAGARRASSSLEDDYLGALSMEYALKAEGYEATAMVGSATEDQACVQDARPDLALMDIRLAGADDGVDVARKLLREHGLLRTVFVTAHNDPGTLQRADDCHPLGCGCTSSSRTSRFWPRCVAP